MTEGKESLKVAGLAAGFGGIEREFIGNETKRLCELEPSAVPVIRRRFQLDVS